MSHVSRQLCFTKLPKRNFLSFRFEQRPNMRNFVPFRFEQNCKTEFFVSFRFVSKKIGTGVISFRFVSNVPRKPAFRFVSFRTQKTSFRTTLVIVHINLNTVPSFLRTALSWCKRLPAQKHQNNSNQHHQRF